MQNIVNIKVTPEQLATLQGLVRKCTFPGIDVQASPAYTGTGRILEIIEGERGHKEAVYAGTYAITLHDVTITIPQAVTESGWRVLARREFVGGSEAVTWYDATEVFDTSSFAVGQCDACGLARSRSYTLIIRKDTRTIQVGGSCVAKYVPAKFEQALRSLAECLTVIRGLSDPDLFDLSGGGSLPRHEPLARLVAIAIELHKQGVPFIPSKDKWGEPQENATWRQVVRALTFIERGVSEGVLNAIHPAVPTPADEVADLVEALRADNPEFGYDWVLRNACGVIIPKVSRILSDRARANDPVVEQVTPPAGRIVVEGKVLSIKQVESQWGIVTKILVDCGGYRLYGSAPSHVICDRDEVVRFKATVEPKEVGFGFYSRPGKA